MDTITTSLLETARRHPMLTAEEECSLARRARAGDEGAVQSLVLSHLRLVMPMARRYARLGLPVQDLVQEGAIGLTQAARRFEPDAGARLSTYALWWVRAAMQDYVVRSWSLVRVGKTAGHRALFFALRRLRAGLRDNVEGLGDEVLNGLAEKFRLPLAEVKSLAQRVVGMDLSLDVPDAVRDAGERAQRWLERLRCESPSPEEGATQTSLHTYWRGLVEKAMESLPYRESVVIRQRFLTETKTSFEAIGHELGCSRDRVRQLEQSALAHLRRLIGARADSADLPA
jgi:RNA polymerase sigma-32 factor